jgi:DNA mismatch endonuclease (patch repair protein)
VSSLAHARRLEDPVDADTSARMANIRQRGTEPELAVRAMLTALGARYRTGNRDLPGSPDLANRNRHWAIFVHGCFWHAHPGCVKATLPKRNRTFWEDKFTANRARDRRAAASLRRLGFRTLVVWECELARSASVARRIANLVTPGTA